MLNYPSDNVEATTTDGLFAAMTTAYWWAAENLAGACGDSTQCELTQGLIKLLDALTRALFNGLRLLGSVGAVTSEHTSTLLKSIVLIVGCEGNLELRLCQATALQLSLGMDKEIAFAALAPAGYKLVELLLPLLKAVETKSIESNSALVPMLVIQNVAEADKEAARQMATVMFTNLEPEARSKEDLGPDPNNALRENDPLELYLFKLLCSNDYNLKRIAGDMMYAVLEEDEKKFVALAGVGNAAGFLQERGMLGMFAR